MRFSSGSRIFQTIEYCLRVTVVKQTINCYAEEFSIAVSAVQKYRGNSHVESEEKVCATLLRPPGKINLFRKEYLSS